MARPSSTIKGTVVDGDYISGSKICPKCHIKKDEFDFEINHAQVDGLDSWCKDCRRKSKAEYRAQHRDRELDWAQKLSFYYGITPFEFNMKLDRQGGVCAICKQPEENGKRLSVDHCHDSNTVRGLLCNACNSVLLRKRHTIELLKSAISYLEFYGGPH